MIAQPLLHPSTTNRASFGMVEKKEEIANLLPLLFFYILQEELGESGLNSQGCSTLTVYFSNNKIGW